MKVNVRLYKSTGYNMIDRPDSALTIESLATDFMDIPDVYVVQNHGLRSITIPLTYQQSRYIDYVRLTSHNPTNDVYNPDQTGHIETIYYVLTAPPHMINEHSCELYMQEDYIPTFGLRKADFTSGLINVAHVPVDDWRYAQVPEDRFSPPGILELKQQELDSAFISGSSEDNTMKTIMNSTIDPVATAKNEYAILNTGYAALDPAHSGNVHVAVPKVERPEIDFKTQYIMKRLSNVGTTIPISYYPPYYSYFLESKDVDLAVYTKEQDTLNFIRSLGLFDSILSMYDVNNVYIQAFNYTAVNKETRTLQLDSNTSKTFYLGEEKLTKVEPIFKYFNNSLNSVFNFEYSNGYTPKNKKVYCGDNNKYILVSKSTGSKIEINPEDCMELLNNAPTTNQPSIIITADLRAGGAPKALFRYMYNGANSGMIGVNGMSWANHQNNYFGQYGTEIANNSFRLGASQNLQNANFGQFQNVAKLAGDLAGAVASGGTGNMIAGSKLMSQGSAMAGSNMIYDSEAMSTFYRGQDLLNRGGQQSSKYLNNSTLNTVVDVFQNELNYRQRQAQLDYANMMATGATKSPIIEFPFSESSREIFGNYFTIYRTVYTAKQMKQLDDFYTMWGYKVGGIEITGESDEWFKNREYFNYISMSNVSLNYLNMSIEEKEGLAAELGNVRLWHNRLLPYQWNLTMGNRIISNVIEV